MRNCCIKSFNKVYEQDYQLKTKEKGRNQDIPVSQMQNYNKVKKQYEKNKKLQQIDQTFGRICAGTILIGAMIIAILFIVIILVSPFVA